MNAAAIQADFDEIARLSGERGGHSDRYDEFLVSQVPKEARRILDVGCGLGRLAVRLAVPGRHVIGIDLSPEMIARARRHAEDSPRVEFRAGDFFTLDLGREAFDVVISAGVLHHMKADDGVARMTELLAAGGRLIVHDLRDDDGLLDQVRAAVAFSHNAIHRLVRTGQIGSSRALRDAWAKHGADEVYPTWREARAMAARLLPGAELVYHWLWRYTLVWDKPA